MLLQCTSFAVTLLFAFALEDNRPQVRTPLGKIIGQYKRSYGGRTFSAFEGIPYAKPPTGDLRFEEPVEAEAWLRILEATKLHVCPQPLWPTNQIIGDEDCLYLNIYIPSDPKPHEKIDVLVYIHGGAFVAGSPGLGGPEYLMDRNILYVTMNYRLGLLGFLSTEDNVVSGNNGLKDQVLALKWIQKNIEHFGGNPKSVTITGMSAGGACVHYHYLSRHSRGLFHRGIAQSGIAIAPWTLQKGALEKARKLAVSVGCNNSSTTDFVECMKKKSAVQLTENVSKFYGFPAFPVAIFGPVVEKASENAFLSDHPYKLLTTGKVNDIPLVISITADEGTFGFAFLNGNLDKLNKYWTEALPHVLDYNYTVTKENKAVVAQKIKQFYFNGETIRESNIHSLIKLFGDRYFTLDFEKSCRLHAKFAKAPVFCYIYGYKGNHNFSSLFGLDKFGVGHEDDAFVFYTVTFGDIILKKDKFSESDEKIKDLLLDLHTSFAKNGAPEAANIDWEPVSNSDDFNYLFVHKPNDVGMVFTRELAPTEFWDSLPIMENEKA